MSYPDNNPKTQFGLKKAPLHLVPPALELGAAEAFQNGADKYGPFNWRSHQISATVYYAACKRHMDDWFDRKDQNDAAPDSGIHHIKHAAACLAMILDVMDTPMFNDNRPTRRPTCQAATTSNTKKPTKNSPRSSKSARSATRRERSSKKPAGSTKVTVSTSTTRSHSPWAVTTNRLIGASEVSTPTGRKAT